MNNNLPFQSDWHGCICFTRVCTGALIQSSQHEQTPDFNYLIPSSLCSPQLQAVAITFKVTFFFINVLFLPRIKYHYCSELYFSQMSCKYIIHTNTPFLPLLFSSLVSLKWSDQARQLDLERKTRRDFCRSSKNP